MSLPNITMRQLIEAGVHFGHNARRWNPKMAPFIYGVRDNVHIMDLGQTVPNLYRAMEAVRDVAAKGGKILFVATKAQAQQVVADAANRCGQYYVNKRWLGGMLTNWKTISASIKRLKDIDARMEKDGFAGMTKKEKLNIEREREKSTLAYQGIKYGNFLQTVVDFLIIALTIFWAVRLVCKLRVKKEEPAVPAPAPEPPPTPEDILLLREIRDALKNK